MAATKREFSIGILSPVIVAVALGIIYWLYDQNTHDTEYIAADKVITEDIDKRLAPMEFTARVAARKEIRVLSDKIRGVNQLYPADSPAEREDRLDLYNQQLDAAHADFELYDED